MVKRNLIKGADLMKSGYFYNDSKLASEFAMSNKEMIKMPT